MRTAFRRGFWCRFCCSSKAAGLVQSIRGAAGGYQLAREPDEITLLDVMTVVDAQLGQAATNATRNTRHDPRPARTWKEVAAKERELLDSVTFAALVERLKGRRKGCITSELRCRVQCEVH